MYKIFIVEDDTVISSEIRKYLIQWGYEVKCALDFNNIIDEFIKYDPQLVLMDISLPFYNGYYWCKEIRKISKIPIMFISSAKDNMNILMALNMGGDDFISKPFELSVLLAKIQAILRRSYSYNEKNNYQEYKGILFNTLDASLIYKEQKIDLTKNEFKIIQILFENIREIVSREQIMKRLWDNECFVDDNTLTVNINRLRKKLEKYGIEDFIKTKKGLGYIIGE